MAQDRLVRHLVSASISWLALSLFLVSSGWNAVLATNRAKNSYDSEGSNQSTISKHSSSSNNSSASNSSSGSSITNTSNDFNDSRNSASSPTASGTFAATSSAPLKQASHVQSIRLASFAPSCTELLQAIKADKDLIGACKYCDLPELNPANIVGDFNSANLERLTRLNPDMVLTVSGQDALTNSLKKNRFTVTTFPNSQLTDISNNLRLLGKLTKREKLALEQAEAFERSIKDLKSICCSTTNKKPAVFFCVWPQPLMTAGQLSFLDQAITVCGGTNIAHNLISAYPQFSLERLLIANPDVVIMPFESNVTAYLKRTPWTELKASRQHKVYFVPKYENNRLSRPSTFVIDGLYWLGKTLHPEKAKELASWIKKSQSEQGRAK